MCVRPSNSMSIKVGLAVGAGAVGAGVSCARAIPILPSAAQTSSVATAQKRFITV
jgi:hypothetical protein